MNESGNNILVDYYSYINKDEIVFDNAGLMLLKLLNVCGLTEVTLAGFDGFKTKYSENYYNSDLNMQIDKDTLKDKQDRMAIQLKEMGKKMKIKFLTSSIYKEEI